MRRIAFAVALIIALLSASMGSAFARVPVHLLHATEQLAKALGERDVKVTIVRAGLIKIAGYDATVRYAIAETPAGDLERTLGSKVITVADLTVTVRFRGGDRVFHRRVGFPAPNDEVTARWLLQATAADVAAQIAEMIR